MSAIKILRLVGAVSLVATAPALLAAAAYAQTAPPPQQNDTQVTPPTESPAAPPAATPDSPATPAPTTPSPSPSPSPSDSAAAPSLMTPASSVQVGSPVYGADGEKLGQVEGVKAQSNGGIDEIHVKTGGFFGFWTKTIAVSGDKVANGGENVRLAVTSDEFKKMPPLTEEDTKS